MDDAKANSQAYRRSYGRGLFDGLRMAGIDDPEDFVKERKLSEAEAGVTGLSKRILDAVPKESPWPTSKIINELRRRGANPEHQFVVRCIVELKQLGLVHEPEFGKFIRAKIPRHVEADKPKSEEAHVQNQNKPSTMDRLAHIAASLRNLAKDVEDAAIETEERIGKTETDASKLRQLQEIIKSIG